jgi:hypothetical protein
VEYVIQVVENQRYGHGGDDPVVTAFAADHMPTWTTSQLRPVGHSWRAGGDDSDAGNSPRYVTATGV